MRLFRKKKPSPLKLFREKQNYPVEAAFELGGRTFFRFSDINNQPSGRTLASIPLWIQLKNNCDDNFLRVHVAAQETIFSDPSKISIEKLITLKNQLKDRLQWVFTPALVYDYASVVYFDESENPTTYDEAYGQKKIAFWKEHATVESFFLSEPIMNLVPALNAVKDSFPTYLDTLLKAQRMQLEQLSDILSTARISPEEMQNLSSLIMILKNRYSSDNYPLTNISSSLTEKLNVIKH